MGKDIIVYHKKKFHLLNPFHRELLHSGYLKKGGERKGVTLNYRVSKVK